MGGFRVGVVEELKPEVRDGRTASAAASRSRRLKLDKKLEPLARDTELRVRPRSALGLKYVELKPGTSKDTFAAGDTIPVKNASEPLEFEDLLLDLRPPRRAPHIQNATAGLRRRLRRPRPVDQPRDRGAQPAVQVAHAGDGEPRRPADRARPVLPPDRARLGRRSRRWPAPRRVLFTDMADTFAAISAQPAGAPGRRSRSRRRRWTSSIDSFRVQQPFLADFTDLSPRLRPAADELPRSLPGDQRRLRGRHAGAAETVELNENLEGASARLDDLFENPNTLLALRDLDTALTVTPPGARVHRPVPDGLQLLRLLPPPARRGPVRRPDGPDRRRHGAEPEREGAEHAAAEQLRHDAQLAAVGHPRRARSRRAPRTRSGNPLFRLYAPPYQPGDRRPGQRRLPARPGGLPERPAQQRRRLQAGNIQDGSDEHGLPIPGQFGTGANGAIVTDDNNIPGLSGGTYKSRELGIDNLADVP